MVPPAKILLVGDSLTQQGCQRGGWVSDLAERYVRRADVLNRGFSGYNTRWILACMDRVTEGIDRACFATVWLGANDAALADGPASSQHVPVKEYRRSLRDIVEHVRRVADHVILMTPPPVDDSVRADQMHERGLGRSPDRTDMATAVYAKACAQVRAGGARASVRTYMRSSEGIALL